MKILHAILAAGASSRYGSNKLLSDYQGKPLIDHAIQASIETSCACRYLITGKYHQALKQHIKSRGDEGIQILFNPL